MIINYNVSSMIANNALARNDSALSKSLERLSSGYKINHAKDNAAGLAMSRRMNAQLKGLSVAGDNANDGISIVEIADGAMSEVHDILQRMNELAVKSSNGTLTDDDRIKIDEEVQALKDEVERIGETTQFNGKNLLDGSFDLKGYSNNSGVKVDYYDENMQEGCYICGSLTCVFDKDGNLKEGTGFSNVATTAAQTADGTAPEGSICTCPDCSEARDLKVSYEYDEITISGPNNFEIRMTIDKNTLQPAAGGIATVADDGTTTITTEPISLDLTGMGSMTLQIGANEDQTLELRMPPITKKNLGLTRTDVLTQENAGKAIEEIASAITFVSSIRSSLGAYQNRLEHTTTNLDVTSENMTSAYSRIMDVDMATEMTKYSSMQVISQAATSMLAQANERPSQVLQLLQ